MAGKSKHTPWFSYFSDEELQEWEQEDPAAFKEYIVEQIQEFDRIQRTLRPGEPNPMAFEYAVDDPGYARSMEDFREAKQLENMETAMGLAIFKTRPPKARNPDIVALGSKNPADRANASEILQIRELISRDLARAEDHRKNGRLREAAEAEQRAHFFSRDIERTYREQPYSFVEEGRKQHLKVTLDELEAASKLSPKEIEANREHWEGLIEAYNLSNDSDHSFTINGASPYDQHRDPEPRIMRIDHEGTSGTRMAQSRSGLSTLDKLITQGFGVASPPVKERPIKAEETEEDSGHPLESASTDEIKTYLENKGVAMK